MRPEKFPVRKLAFCIVLASLMFTPLFSTNSIAKAQTPSPQPDQPAWTLEYDLSAPIDQADAVSGAIQAQAQVESMLSSKQLQNQGIQPEVASGQGTDTKVTLQGRGSLDDLRSLIFSKLSPELDLLGGPVAVELSAPVKAGQIIPVTLEARPSTGYLWDLDSSGSQGVAQPSQPVLKSMLSEPSAPAKSSLTLVATMTGSATIRLLYHRVWESAAETTRRLALSLPEFPAQIDLSDPVQPEQIDPPQLDAPVVGEPSVGLPAQFDWRAQGKVPPVRNQGACGSCWAFGTVGVMESAMMVQAGVQADLSEQYLISCNSDGWGCNGGWWGHDYHQSKPGKNQSAAGAVFESADRYSASKGTCKANYTHPYKIASWGYVSGGFNAVPPVDQIKNAIYTYGPVAAAVCTGSAWSSYRGGVFSKNESSQCNGGVNHAILLVGWDDSTGSWILRNSWGSNWGEKGYMHIKYGTSNVGYGATYVVFDKPDMTPPANDNRGSAKSIGSSGGTVSYKDILYTYGASTEGGDPQFPSKAIGQGKHSVWYRFDSFGSGSITASTKGSGYDTVLGVWKDVNGQLKLVKWNDNAYGKQAALSFSTKGIATYYIEIVSKSNTGGTLTFNYSFKPSIPGNDKRGSAVLVREPGKRQPTSYSAAVDVARATVASNDPVLRSDLGKGYRTIWYRFVPAENGILNLTNGGSNFNAIFSIWQVKSGKLQQVTVGDNNVQAQLIAKAVYYIEAASHDTSAASRLNFGLRFTPQ